MYHSDLTVARDGESKADWLTRIERELYGSKKIIDQKLGQDTVVLAYPYGNYDERSVVIAREAGYKIAMSVKRGGNPFFTNPLYPYTKTLISAVPVVSEEERQMKPQKQSKGGEIPSPINPPSGCAFHPRCSLVEPICSQELPDLVELIPGHFVRCHVVSRKFSAKN